MAGSALSFPVFTNTNPSPFAEQAAAALPLEASCAFRNREALSLLCRSGGPALPGLHGVRLSEVGHLPFSRVPGLPLLNISHAVSTQTAR